MKIKSWFHVFLINLVLITNIFSPAKAGNDFVAVKLRTDDYAVYMATDYQVWLGANQHSVTNFPTFTTAWLSVHFDDEPVPFGWKFSQVGIMTDATGIFWFVYSEVGVQCFRGSYAWYNQTLDKYLGCKGAVDDLVGFGNLHKVQLVTYGEGYWIARVYDENETPHDVAKFPFEGIRIYDAKVVMEEGWAQTQDPYETALYYMWHPQYKHPSGDFLEWPFSVNQHENILYANPSLICPVYYGANVDILDDPRFWFAGSGGTVCNSIMFPPTDFSYLPSIIK